MSLAHVTDSSLRCINRFPLLDSTNRRAAPDMHHDQISLLLRFVQKFSDRAEDKRITDSVKSVFSEAVRLGHFLVDGVRFYVLGKRLMECAIEIGDASDIGEFFSTCANNFQRREVVSGWSESNSVLLAILYLQRSQILNPSQGVISLVIDLHGLWVIPSMYNPMADIRQVVNTGNFRQFWIGKASFEQKLERILRRAQLILQLLLVCLIAFGIFKCRRGRCDP